MNEQTVPADPRIGTVLQGRYRILDRLAAGGMGVVYRGERLELGRTVAIKLLHPWVAADPSFQLRFQREAQAMSRLSHPCCVSVIDFGVEDNASFLVMDFITGRTLRALLRGGPPPIAQVLGIVRQVLAGLGHAHTQGIVHRDIKPDNIILTETTGLGEQVRILDFGLARLRDAVSGLTAGFAVGTPSYMAPEQIRGEEVDARTDLYAVGVLLFELLTGIRPFSGEQPGEVMRQHRDVVPPALRAVVPERNFSEELEAVVSKAMAKSPGERFQSATDFITALEATPEASGRAVARAVSATPSVPEALGDTSMEPTLLVSHSPVQAAATLVASRSPATQAPTIVAPHSPAQVAPTPVVLPPPELLLPPLPPRAVEVEAGAVEASAARARPRWLTPAAWTTGALLLGALVLMFVTRKEEAAESTLPAKPAAKGQVAKAEPAPAPAVGTPPGPEVAPPQAPATRPPEKLPGIERIHRWMEARQWSQALRALASLRKQFPDSAYAPYLEGHANFADTRWVDGIASYQAALRNNPDYRSDPELIRHVIECLVSDRFHHRCASFLLSDIGAPAAPLLEEAARSHEYANVRSRAARLLQKMTPQRRAAPGPP